MKGFKEEIGQLMALSHDNEKCYRHLYIHTTKEDLKIDKNKKIKNNAESRWVWFNLGDNSASIYTFKLWHGT